MTLGFARAGRKCRRVAHCGPGAAPLPFSLATQMPTPSAFRPLRKWRAERSRASPQPTTVDGHAIRVRLENVPWFEEAPSLDFSLRGKRFRSQRGCATGELLRIALEGASSAPSPGAQEFRVKSFLLLPARRRGSGRRRLPRNLAGRPLHFAADFRPYPILRYTENPMKT